MSRRIICAQMIIVTALATFALTAPRPAAAFSNWIKDLHWQFSTNYSIIEFTTDPYFIPFGNLNVTQSGQVILSATIDLSGGWQSVCTQTECHWSFTANENVLLMYPDCSLINFEIFSGIPTLLKTPAASTATINASTYCPGVMGSIRGMAFEDKNGNGKWDVGEPSLGGMWYKITGGGNWFVCGYVGDDNTYGVTVQPGKYFILPVAPKGYRTTTPRIATEVTRRDDGIWTSLSNNIGFIKDDKTPGEACDQYHPSR